MAKLPVKIFISYAHKDAPFFEVFRDGVKNHLSTSSVCDFSSWTDDEIPLGSNWDEQIQNNLGNADVAVLCVSANFLNSRYIKADEFGVLLKKYPATLIIPIYFNHCNINAWEELAIKQFFKPPGNRYGEAAQADFAFCDLVEFRKSDGLFLPNPNIDLYLQDFAGKLEKAVTGNTSITEEEPEQRQNSIKPGGKNDKEKTLTDKIVEYVILAAIILSLAFIVQTFALNKTPDADAQKFKGAVWGAMFFGSSGLFIVNRKFQHS